MGRIRRYRGKRAGIFNLINIKNKRSWIGRIVSNHNILGRTRGINRGSNQSRRRCNNTDGIGIS